MKFDPIIFHVDLDAFFAAVEQRDNPQLQGKPVIVGSLPGERGVVSTCSYEARAFGVRSALPISRAYELCPQGIYIRPRMTRYMEVSRQIMKIFDDFSPLVLPMSVDEAFLDMTGTTKLFGPPLEAGKILKNRIWEDTGLRASVGIAPNHYLAKLASDYDKPDGLYQVSPENILSFLDSLSLGKLHGVGEKTLERLHELGIRTVAQLREYALPVLQQLLGNSAGQYLYNSCRGLETQDYHGEPNTRSLSAERTYQEDVTSPTAVHKTLLDLSQECMFRLYEEGWKSRTVHLKLRYQDFSTSTVQKTLGHWVSSTDELYKASLELLKTKWNGRPAIRLVGLGLGNLQRSEALEQVELFDDQGQKNRRVEQAVLKLRGKYPGVEVNRAGLLKPGSSLNPTRTNRRNNQ